MSQEAQKDPEKAKCKEGRQVTPIPEADSLAWLLPHKPRVTRVQLGLQAASPTEI